MNEADKSILTLFLIGVIAVVGKVLSGGEKITLRLFIGRTLSGGLVSMVAGVALVQFPDLSPVAVNGLGAVLGIAGYQTLELLIQRRLNKGKDHADQ